MTRGVSRPLPCANRLACAAVLLTLLAAAPARAQTGGDCQPSPETLCLMDDRFQVEVDWSDFSPNPLGLPGTPDDGTGAAVNLPETTPSTDEGYFWFFTPDDVEVVVKVLDGRSINGHFWVFAGSLTNLGYRITVVDTETDAMATYRNEPGTTTTTFDTRAFEDAPSGEIRAEATAALERLVAPGPTWSPLATGAPPRARVLPSHELPSCQSPEVACAQGGRIAIQTIAPSIPGAEPETPGTPILETGSSALFSYLDNGFALGVKVVDGRAINGEFWTYVSGTSFQGVEVTVTDLVTHESVTYVQEGQPALSFADNQPFAPDPPSDEWMETAELPGFRFQTRVTGGGQEVPTRQEADCVPETLCVSGALAGRSELFLRIVGPKPNGFLQPNLVKFSTSQIEVWIEQTATGQVNYYTLDAAGPASSDLTGFFDRRGFPPAP